MEIVVNHTKMTVAEECSVQALIDQVLGQKQKGIAIAVGTTIISRNDWNKTRLKEKDSVTIITATQGG